MPGVGSLDEPVVARYTEEREHGGKDEADGEEERRQGIVGKNGEEPGVNEGDDDATEGIEQVEEAQCAAALLRENRADQSVRGGVNDPSAATGQR